MQPFLYWIPIIELIFFIIFIRFHFGKGFSLIKIFNFSWLINHLIYALQFYDYFQLKSEILLYSTLFIFSVNVFFCIYKKGSFPNFLEEREKLKISIGYFRKIVGVICVASLITWIASFSRLRNALKLISQFGMVAMRDFAFDEVTYTTVEKLIYNYFVQPIIIISILFAAITIPFRLYEKKAEIVRILLVALLNATVYSLLFGGRSILIQIVFYIAFGLVITSNFTIKGLLKQKKIILFLIIIAIPIVAYSSMRVTRSWGLIKEFGLYLTGGLGYLSSAPVDMYGTLLGRCTFGCLYDTLGLICKILGFEVKLASQYYSDFANPILTIGTSIRTNFTATCMGAFLLDFGWFGVVIGGYIYGSIFSLIENMYNQKPSIYRLILLLYFSNCALETIQNYTFKGVGFLFVMVFLYLFFHFDLKRNRLFFTKSARC